MKPKILIENYNYILPESKIAKYPTQERDESRLLYFDGSEVFDKNFSEIVKLLPSNSVLIRNITKVIPARLLFKKDSGAVIEIFLLEPHIPYEYSQIFFQKSFCEWNCTLGNAKKWKDGAIFIKKGENDILISAQRVLKSDKKTIIRFEWQKDLTFAEIIDIIGKIPIPPYLKRDSETIDQSRYQTVYALNKGSVAAPTAGLHFTHNVEKTLSNNSIQIFNLTLHVGAGTFLPVKSLSIDEHVMHSEKFTISKELISSLINNLEKQNITSVGTTSTRALESIYYLGVHLLNESSNPGKVTQWEAYDSSNYSTQESLNALLNWMNINNIQEYSTTTEIIIVPGFKFRIVNRLITNFHQPKSTLLLLVAAFVGETNLWKIYNHALKNEYRFLSYGDSSLLVKNS